ncbi:MOSC domain-containing protein [Ectopseudomonas mendocina]|uniref:MOSC domain-containing protein n=1 Tax=Ectopseudomonas mendocina TaxID=300 RepID=A0ABZ2RAY6_ECTME
MLQLSELYRYPIKSCAGETLAEASLGALGVQGDRRWMVVDAETGRFLTQRLLSQMTQLHARWQGDGALHVSAPGMPELEIAVPGADDNLKGVTIWRDTLEVPDAGDQAAKWFSDWLQRPCRLVQVPDARARHVINAYPKYAQAEDRVAFADGFPLLLIGQASLDDLSRRVGRPLSMLRFRPNLVVAGAEPYAEDSWKRIRIGEMELRVAKGCARCIMTTLDPETGERSEDREPLTTLMTYRKRDDGIYFGQNLVPCGEGRLVTGMPVEVIE